MRSKDQIALLVIIVVCILMALLFILPNFNNQNSYRPPSHNYFRTRTVFFIPIRQEKIAEFLAWYVDNDEYMFDSYIYRNIRINSYKKYEDKANKNYPNMVLNNEYKVGEKVLFEIVNNKDYLYALYDIYTEDIETIVGITENARFQFAEGEKIIFYAKGGDDVGNLQFPYQVVYDIETRSSEEKQLFIDRDVVFGAPFSWKHELVDITVTNDEVAMRLVVPEGQVPAGGHRLPFTIVNMESNILGLRIFGVVVSEDNHDIVTNSNKLFDIRLSEIETPIENSSLLREDYPYGALMENISIDRSSILIEVEVEEFAVYDYSIETYIVEDVAEYILTIRILESNEHGDD